MKHATQIVAFAALAALVACAPQGGSTGHHDTVDTAAIEASIREQIDEFVVAWNARDYATIEPMLAADIVLQHPEQPLMTGRETVLPVLDEGFDLTVYQQTAVTDEVIVMGDHVYTRGSWRVDARPDAEGDFPPAGGKWTVLFERADDGTWQMWRWMWNAPSPAAQP